MASTCSLLLGTASSSSSSVSFTAACRICSRLATTTHVHQLRQFHAATKHNKPAASISTYDRNDASARRNAALYPGHNAPGRSSSSPTTSTRNRYPHPNNPSRSSPPRHSPAPTPTPFRPLPHPALDPYLLAERLKKLCIDDKIDEAVEMLRTSRKEAVNAAVYNILIAQVLQKQKNKLAWTLWMDMKRAGIVPTPKSYTTFFSSIVPSSVTPSFLENVNTVHKQWQAFASRESCTVHSAKSKDPLGPEYRLTSIPTNAYLTLLAQLQPLDLEVLERIFGSLPRTGPVSRTRESYTILIRAISSLILSATDEQLPALIAKISEIWQAMLAAHRAREITLDARAITTVIHAWRSIHFRDKRLPIYSLRMQVIDEIASLFDLPLISQEGVEHHEKQQKAIQADSHSLLYAMALANQFGGKCGKVCYDWFEAIRKGEVRTVPASLLENRHCEIVMRAEPDAAEEILIWQLRSSAPRLRPDLSTYSTAMRCSNYSTALRILAHMSGSNDTLLHAFEVKLLEQDSPASTGIASNRASKGYHTRKLKPDAKCLRILAEKALASGEIERMDRTLGIIQQFITLPARQKGSMIEDEQASLNLVCAKIWAKIRQDPGVSRERKAELQITFGH